MRTNKKFPANLRIMFDTSAELPASVISADSLLAVSRAIELDPLHAWNGLYEGTRKRALVAWLWMETDYFEILFTEDKFRILPFSLGNIKATVLNLGSHLGFEPTLQMTEQPSELESESLDPPSASHSNSTYF